MEFKTVPYKHQQEAFDRFKDHDYKGHKVLALLADMGTGKSKIAIDLISYRYLKGEVDRVLIIAPADVHPQWVNEQFPEHCSVDCKGFSYSSSNKISFIRAMDKYLMFRKGDKDLCVFTMNYEAFAYPKGLQFAKQFLKTSDKPPVIIVDEASRIKTPDIATTRNIKKLRELFFDGMRIAVTGTPAAKGPVDLWSIYDFLIKRFFGCSYITFVHEHSIVVKKKLKVKNRLITTDVPLDRFAHDKIIRVINNNRENGKINPYAIAHIRKSFGLSESDFWLIASSPDFNRYKNVDQLQQQIAPITFAITKAECLNLPPKVYKKIEFELNPTQKRLIKELKSYSAAHYEGMDLTIETKALLGLRVLQICGGFFSHNTDIEGEFKAELIEGKNAKLQYLLNDIPEIGEQQFIIWAAFVPEIEMLIEKLQHNFSIGALYGNIDKHDRPAIVQDFKAGKIQGLISHPDVGGYGLNLQAGEVQYWYSRNYRTEARLQAEDRSHRIGTVKSPVYKDLLYNVKFEHAVLESLQEGADINSKFVSSDINEMFELT